MFCVASVAGCKKKAPVAPDPVEATDTFTGTVSPGGQAFHQFNVTYSYATSGAGVTVTSLTTVANGTPQTSTIGISFGSINFGVCTPVISNPTVALNTEVLTNSDTFLGPSTYCVRIYDNPAAPTVTEPLNYSFKVRHY